MHNHPSFTLQGQREEERVYVFALSVKLVIIKIGFSVFDN